MERWLFVAGAMPLLVLGIMHNIYTLLDVVRPSRIIPSDRGLMDQMKASTLRLTKETDMWKAWVGFNLSHGIGMIAISGFYLYMALYQFEALQAIDVLIYAAPVLAGMYAILSWLYWFRIPLVGSVLSTALFSAAVFI